MCYEKGSAMSVVSMNNAAGRINTLPEAYRCVFDLEKDLRPSPLQSVDAHYREAEEMISAAAYGETTMWCGKLMKLRANGVACS